MPADRRFTAENEEIAKKQLASKRVIFDNYRHGVLFANVIDGGMVLHPLFFSATSAFSAVNL